MKRAAADVAGVLWVALVLALYLWQARDLIERLLGRWMG